MANYSDYCGDFYSLIWRLGDTVEIWSLPYYPGELTALLRDGIFWSEIGSGYGEPGGTLPPRIPRNTPLPPPPGISL